MAPRRWLLVAALLSPPATRAAEEYESSAPVTLYANKVGPFANPSEVYAFYNLPYCAPAEVEIKREDLGPLLKGDRNAWSGLNATPLQDVLIFFHEWLKDEDPNSPWQMFAQPHLAHERGWAPEQLVHGDFSLWMREIQRRLYKRAGERARGAGPSGQQ